MPVLYYIYICNYAPTSSCYYVIGNYYITGCNTAAGAATGLQHFSVGLEIFGCVFSVLFVILFHHSFGR